MDIGDHSYIPIGKKFIDNKYPLKHSLIIGNSKLVLPKLYSDNKDKKYDLIFIDGGHDYETALNDLKNSKKLSNENTYIIMDDTIQNNKKLETGWTINPTKVWNKFVNNKKIKHYGSIDFGYGRGQSWGKFIF